MERDKYFDSLKGLLIILVVIGHFIETSKSTFNIDIHNLIYLFHMPLFVFVSGYFSSSNNLRRKTLGLLETYIVFQIIYCVLNNVSLYCLLTEPYMHLWYLFCLVFWRLLLHVIPKANLIYAFAISAIVGLAVGFFDFVNPTFSLARFLVFLPYFLFGKIVRNQDMMPIVRKTLFKYSSYICTIIIIAVIIIHNKDLGWIVYNAHPYSQISSNLYHSLLLRFLLYIVSIPLGISVLNLCHKSAILYKIGTATFSIFLWHWILLMLYQKIGITNAVLDWVSAFITITLLYNADKIKFVKYINNPITIFTSKTRVSR